MVTVWESAAFLTLILLWSICISFLKVPQQIQKLHNLKQVEFILSQFWKPEYELKVSGGLVSLEAERENPSHALLPASDGHTQALHFLA